MNNTSDMTNVVKAAQNDDAAAQLELFTHLRARLLSMAKYILRRGNSRKNYSTLDQDAEDIVQNTLLRIQEKYKQIDFDAGFMPWAFQILRNNIGNYIQKKRREGRLFQKLNEYDLYINGADTTAIRSFARDLKQKISTLVLKLDKICKRIFEIYLSDGERKDILTAFQGVPFGTIDNKIYRCREKLKQQLLREGYSL